MEMILLYITIGLVVLLLVTLFLMFRLYKRLKKLSRGKNAQSLEKIIIENNEIIQKLTKEQKNHKKNIQKLQSDILNNIQKISVLRFDALGDSGGQQSFAIGLTDAHKNGVVISSMYTRNGMKVFAKEIIQGASKHTLTKEEESVIE